MSLFYLHLVDTAEQDSKFFLMKEQKLLPKLSFNQGEMVKNVKCMC